MCTRTVGCKLLQKKVLEHVKLVIRAECHQTVARLLDYRARQRGLISRKRIFTKAVLNALVRVSQLACLLARSKLVHGA